MSISADRPATPFPSTASPSTASPSTRLSLPRLAWDMVRYRVALMMWLFMLLGAAYQGITSWPLDKLVALTLAMAASYVVATTVNDIADADIDKINHPQGRGRPLVHGQATPADLWRLNVIAAAVALAFGAYVGWRGVAVVAFSLVIGYVYSVPPLVISHRTYLAAPVLTVAYVVAPYLHGLALADATPGREDLCFVGGLCLLFLSRILLKDFRDRAGDAAYGKPTLLLRYGKGLTCAVSVAALLAGLVLLAIALDRWLATLIVVAFGSAVVAQLHALFRTDDEHREQIAIGIGARVGNGLLICLLAMLLLQDQHAGDAVVLALVAGVTGLYALTYAVLVRHPDDVLIGYKG